MSQSGTRTPAEAFHEALIDALGIDFLEYVTVEEFYDAVFSEPVRPLVLAALAAEGWSVVPTAEVETLREGLASLWWHASADAVAALPPAIRDLGAQLHREFWHRRVRSQEDPQP